MLLWDLDLYFTDVLWVVLPGVWVTLEMPDCNRSQLTSLILSSREDMVHPPSRLGHQQGEWFLEDR